MAIVSFTPPICSGGWLRKRLRKCSVKFAAAGGRRSRTQDRHRFVQVALVEQQVIGVLQRHVGADFAQRLQRRGDVDLRLVLEESFVAGLPEARRGIDDGFGERVVRDAAIGREIVGVLRLPVRWRVVRPDLEQDKIVLAAEVPRHFGERFPIESFVVDAEAAPAGLVLENLVEQRRDAGARLAGTGVAGDEPAATEVFARPTEAGELDNR